MVQSLKAICCDVIAKAFIEELFYLTDSLPSRLRDNLRWHFEEMKKIEELDKSVSTQLKLLKNLMFRNQAYVEQMELNGNYYDEFRQARNELEALDSSLDSEVSWIRSNYNRIKADDLIFYAGSLKRMETIRQKLKSFLTRSQDIQTEMVYLNLHFKSECKRIFYL